MALQIEQITEGEYYDSGIPDGVKITGTIDIEGYVMAFPSKENRRGLTTIFCDNSKYIKPRFYKMWERFTLGGIKHLSDEAAGHLLKSCIQRLEEHAKKHA